MRKTEKSKMAQKSPQGDLSTFKEGMDGWVKDMNNQMHMVGQVANIVQENTSDIQHNYELIKRLLQEMEALRHEMETMKMVQLVALSQQKMINKESL
jgi:mevalonate kinase